MNSLRSLIASLVVAVFLTVAAAAPIQAERSVGAARVVSLQPVGAADLVLLDAGFNAGLRQGMVCEVRRDGRRLGELLLTELRPDAATALILDLARGASLRPGDHVVVKTLS